MANNTTTSTTSTMNNRRNITTHEAHQRNLAEKEAVIEPDKTYLYEYENYKKFIDEERNNGNNEVNGEIGFDYFSRNNVDHYCNE